MINNNECLWISQTCFICESCKLLIVHCQPCPHSLYNSLNCTPQETCLHAWGCLPGLPMMPSACTDTWETADPLAISSTDRRCWCAGLIIHLGREKGGVELETMPSTLSLLMLAFTLGFRCWSRRASSFWMNWLRTVYEMTEMDFCRGMNGEVHKWVRILWYSLSHVCHNNSRIMLKNVG